MEYFIGAAFTLIALFVFERYIKPRTDVSRSRKAMTTQSYVFLQLREYQDIEDQATKPKMTQSMAFVKSNQVRIIFIDEQAYWIENSRLVVADAQDGVVKKETKKEVDTFTMDKVQLDKTIFIVEKLKEGLPDEGGNPRKS